MLFLRFPWLRSPAGASPREVWAEPGQAALAGSGGLFWLQADCPLPCGLDTDGRLAWQSGSYFWAGACGLTGMQPRTHEGGGFMLNGLNSRGQSPSFSLTTSGCSRLGQAGLRQQVGVQQSR